MLTFDNVSVRQQDTLILENISFTINPGEVAAIHCGVTSREILFSLLTDAHANYSGTIDTANRTLSVFSIRDGLYDRLTVEEYLRFTHMLYESTKSLDAVLQTVQLTPYRNKRLNRLSLSLVRRVQYAALLLHNRDIYVLEEPDQNVDQETRHLFATVLMQLKQQQKAILLLTSNMESALFVTSTVYRIDHRHLRLLDVEPDEPEANEDVTPEVMHVRFEKIPTKVNEKIVLLDPPEIDYIESQDGQSVLHSQSEQFPSVFTMNELETRLTPYGFFRCHRSYIVNLQRVREVITYTKNSFSLVLDDSAKTTIPLSKTKMTELKTMIGLK
ncbi:MULTISPECIES: LytTR family transcriptional regulator DNA-binding domain-containing protein [unclassified Exiguobacterium]|uniref:LytTR family transcriptional regulator DNA-binding domain-containing protein n=1 Tax=unclassified Exiguobacterium TaxID=2644629 RepID=UPI001040DEF4|nr:MULTISPECIES: LytTR family transcriptional regulator DNA-binding domain-containing protein [unclassified Exiguobacterium]TCI67459.1 LytR family transcriptional regulator [Exiguobacterium sp. IPCI3]TCI76797.1 LytR family transcriptional regulator [Exiguobacterium sp. IPCH1]TCI78542.1 LytR family transcriptional regulator [Exiguobacterium sp. IPBC4]